ncbi:MAG: protein kinase, partial [Planctomycetaceae bacterium]|nr:protein kinase [Planctomycetaceae bacterium]
MPSNSNRLAAILSQCDDFWMADESSQNPQRCSGTPGPVARDAAYRRLVSDLIKQQIERDVSSSQGQSSSRIEQYLNEYVDVSFGDSTLLDLVEHEFLARHESGDWPELDEYVRQLPHLESAVRERLQQARNDVVTRTSVQELLGDTPSPSADATLEEAPPASPPTAPCPDATELAETLRQIRPFSELSRHVREAVATHAKIQQFAPGDALVRQGEAADALFILLEGAADVWLNDSGRVHPIAHLQRHTVVGELGLVTQEVRSATVTATTHGCAAIINKDAFEHLAGRYPRLSIAMAELIAERVGTLAIDVLCGKTIDKYLIRQRLGRGATGIVYAAADVETQQPVALKMLRHDLTFDRHATLRFHQEADIIGELQHTNIVAVLSEFSAYGTSFIAMELCNGPSLSDLIARCPGLPLPAVRAIVGQLAAGLACAHAAGIAHRDLKPSNVLLTSDGTVKIVDFGLARYLTAEDPGTTAFGQIVGTPRYMAPEQLSGERGDERSDLFALGCIAYELLAGKPMFTAGRFSELLLERA